MVKSKSKMALKSQSAVLCGSLLKHLLLILHNQICVKGISVYLRVSLSPWRRNLCPGTSRSEAGRGDRVQQWWSCGHVDSAGSQTCQLPPHG